jgi:hypothetical protein
VDKGISRIVERDRTHYIEVITTARVSRTTERAARGPPVAQVPRRKAAVAARLVLEPLRRLAVAEVGR